MPPAAVVEVEKTSDDAPVDETTVTVLDVVEVPPPMELLTHNLRTAAFLVLLLSLLACGSLEGIFGLCAAGGILCCAPPGVKGTTRAARITRLLACVCAGIALGQILLLMTSSLFLPESRQHVAALCKNMDAPKEPAPEAVPAQDGAVASPDPVAETDYYYDADGNEVKYSETTTVYVWTTVARRLKQVAPETMEQMKCERYEHYLLTVAPFIIMCAIIFQACLFAAAMRLAKAAGVFVQAAQALTTEQ